MSPAHQPCSLQPQKGNLSPSQSSRRHRTPSTPTPLSLVRGISHPLTRLQLKPNTLPQGNRREELGVAAVALGCTGLSQPRASGLTHSPPHPGVASACAPAQGHEQCGRQGCERGPRPWAKRAWLNWYFSAPFVPGPSPCSCFGYC